MHFVKNLVRFQSSVLAAKSYFYCIYCSYVI